MIHVPPLTPSTDLSTRDVYIYGAAGQGHAVRARLAEMDGVRFRGFIDTAYSCDADEVVCLSLPEYLRRRSPGDIILVAARRKESILANLVERLGSLDDVFDASDIEAPRGTVENAIAEAARAAGPNAICLDVGANVGETALLMAGESRTVHAFEPNPDLEAEFNRRTTGAARIHRHGAAVSDYRGTTFLNLRGHHTQHFISGAAPLDDRSLEVPVTTIDRFREENGIVPNLIKIDVEGAEPFVIRGAAETIRAHRPTLIFEFHEAFWWRGYARMFRFLHPFYDMVRCEDGVDAWSYYAVNPGEGKMYNIRCEARRTNGGETA